MSDVTETDTTPGRGPEDYRDFWRGTLLSPYPAVAMLLGAALTWLLNRGFPGSRGLGFGAFIGLCCYLLCVVAERLLHEPISRLPAGRGGLVRGVVFCLAGVSGFVFGQSIGRPLFLGQPLALPDLRGGLGVALGVSAALSALVGLPISAYELLKRRLADSIARLKEAEYAEKELELARAIQQRLLPPASIEGPGFAVAARCVPARHVGGDFYDVLHLEEGKLGLAVADVAGKGMGAALVMASAKAVVPLLATSGDPAATLEALDGKLRKELGKREFVALAFAVYDPASGALRLANAGLPDPYLLRPGVPPRSLSCPGPRLPLGLKADVRRETLSVRLEPGDRVVLFSDGLPEAPRPGGEPLGYAALESLLDLPGEVPPGEAVEQLLRRVAAAAGAGPEDDATVLLLERRPA
ncbi:MAG: PP2C family protein-serine/threonine phosphatase [Thermoanaerobaculia bacterium]